MAAPAIAALVLVAVPPLPASSDHASMGTEPAPGRIATIAGSGTPGDAGGPATEGQLHYPMGVVMAPSGDLYIADTSNNRVRRVEASTGTITTVAGTGEYGFGGDGGPATSAQMAMPFDVAIDADGALHISDVNNHRIRTVAPGPDGVVNGGSGETITTSAGGGQPEDEVGDGGPATGAALMAPNGLFFDSSGNLYVATADRVRKIDAATTTITTVAGGGIQMDGALRPLRNTLASRDGLPATMEAFGTIADVAVDATNNLFLTDSDRNRIRRVVPGLDGVLNGGNDEIISTVAGGGQPVDGVGDGGPATDARLERPAGLALDGLGRILIAEYGHRIRRVDRSGTITTMAGTGQPGYNGDGGASHQAQLDAPQHMERHGDVIYFADTGNHRIRAVRDKPLGVVMTDSPDPVGAGQQLSYRAQVESSVESTGVKASVALPEQAGFASATSTQGSCAQAGTSVSCDLGGLSPGAIAEVTVQVTAPPVGGTISATAAVSSDQGATDTFVQTTTVSTFGCGRLVTASTTLTEDIGPCAGAGIIVGADAVTLDLGGHRVFGLPGPGNGHQAGIEVPDRTGVTVKNGTVSGFDAGVFLKGGDGNHTISGMTLTDNLGPDTTASYLGDGIYVENSPGAHIVGNTLANNGIFDGIGIYGVRSAAAVVEDNLVHDSRGPSTRQASYGQGIIVNAFVNETDQGKTVPGIRLLNNTIRGSDSAGISNFNSTDGAVVANTVVGNGRRNANGNGIGIQVGPGAAPGTRLLVQDNEVHGNRGHGIFAGKLATGNRIRNNDAADNVGFDLHDDTSSCAGNVWSENSWGSGGYDPECTTAGGTRATTRPPVADLDGNGSTDVAVFRAGSGSWFTHDGTEYYWGTAGDVAVPADYDGVTGSEVAVFRPSSGTWFVKDGQTTTWGTEGDLPVPGDYDGDRKADLAVFRPSSGSWYIRPSRGGADQSVGWGTTGDVPVPGDYNGDGTTEIAVFRPSSGTWFVQGGPTIAWGTEGDIPVPGNFDGNASTDIAVFRPSSGTWFVNGGPTIAWGTEGDIPVPGNFDGNASADIAVFRPSSGTWFVNGGPTTNWGTAGDQPLPLPPAIRQSLPT